MIHPNLASPFDKRFSPTSLEEGCWRKYYFNKIMRLRRMGEKSHFLTMGSSIHSFVENFYMLRRKEPSLSQEATLALALEKSQPEIPAWPSVDPYSYENWLLTCEAYASRYYSQGVVPFQTETIFWLPMDNGTFLGGVIDQVWETPSGALVVRDTKTTGRPLTDWYWKNLENKFQLTIYAWALSQLFPDRDILGVEIDAVLISKDMEKDYDKHFSRRIYERSEIQMEEALLTYAFKTNHILQALAKPEDRFLLEFPCETSQCGNYGGCPYLPICTEGLNTPAVRTDFYIDNLNQEGDES
jgi:hypothetical protein